MALTRSQRGPDNDGAGDEAFKCTSDPRDEGDNGMGNAGHATTEQLALISKHNQRRTNDDIFISSFALIGSIQDQNNGK
jgi:hypothetical protein